ncbi:MAG: hypothetical protein ABWZ13_01205 [Acidimicrobiales bacterium]
MVVPRRSRVLVAVAVVAALLVGLVAWAPWRAEYAVDGPVVAANEDDGIALMALLGGELELVDGCLRLGDESVVWPRGTRWNEGQRAVELRDGTLLHDGDTISGGGGSLGADDPAFEDGGAARALGRCRVEGQAVAFFNASETVEVTTG